MITMYFTDCQWGVDPIDDGIQINLFEPDAKIVAQIPFTGEALKQLIELAAGELTQSDREEIFSKLES